MPGFNILILRDFLTDTNFKIILEAFSNLYHNVTPKHKRRMEIHVVSENDNHDSITKLGEYYDISNKISIVDSLDVKAVKGLYRKASVLVMPVEEEVAYAISDIFVCGIPVLCYDTPSTKGFLDSSCAMMVKNRSNSALKEIRMAEVFLSKIKMLYFDPEVQKLLKKGAEALYHRNVNATTENVDIEKSSIFNYFKHPVQSLLNKIESTQQVAAMGGH